MEKDNFLDGLDVEEPLDGTTSTDDLFPDETVVEEEEKVEKSLPFHKDPKNQKYLDKMERKMRERLLEELKPTATETFRKEVTDSGDDEIVRALTRLVGNDTDEKKSVLADLKSALDKREERSVQKATEQLMELQRNQESRYEQEVEEAQEEIEEGFEDIEEHFSISLNDRQKDAFKEFLVRIQPKGGYEEYPDFVETFQVFRDHLKANRPSNSQAKALASRGVERSSSVASTTKNTFLEADRGKGETLWQKFDRLTNK